MRIKFREKRLVKSEESQALLERNRCQEKNQWREKNHLKKDLEEMEHRNRRNDRIKNKLIKCKLKFNYQDQYNVIIFIIEYFFYYTRSLFNQFFYFSSSYYITNTIRHESSEFISLQVR